VLVIFFNGVGISQLKEEEESKESDYIRKKKKKY
jgi:hypothetical protein